MMRATYRVFDAAARTRRRRPRSRISAPAASWAARPRSPRPAATAREIDLDRVNVAVDGSAAGRDRGRRDAGAALCGSLPPDVAPKCCASTTKSSRCREVALQRARRDRRATSTTRTRYVLRHRGEIVMDVDIEFLTGAMRYDRPYTEVHPPRRRERRSCRRSTSRAALPTRARASRCLLRASRSIGATTGSCAARTRSPRGAADAGVIAPVPGSPLGVALAVAGNPRYGAIDPATRPSTRSSKRCATSSRSARDRSGSPIV